MKKLSLIAPFMVTNAAAVVTAIASTPAMTNAEVIALAELLTILGNRKDLLFPALRISATAKDQIQPE